MEKFELHLFSCSFIDTCLDIDEQIVGPRFQEVGNFPTSLFTAKALLLENNPDMNITVHAHHNGECVQNILTQCADLNNHYVGLLIHPMTIFWMEELGGCIKSSFPNSKIFAFGSATTKFLLDNCFPSYLDFFINGEPDLAVSEIINRLYSGEPLKELDVKGLVMRETFSNPSQTDPIDINQLPSIYTRELLGELYDGNHKGVVGTKNWITSIYETTRSCPYRCSYCYLRGSEGMSRKDTSLIEKEIDAILSFGVKNIILTDPVFNLDTYSTLQILDILHKKLLGPYKDVYVHPQIKIETLSEEVIKAFKGLNCLLGIGLQSNSEDILKNVNRHFNRALFEKNIALLNKHEIPFYIDLIPGLPGDTFEIYKEGFNYCSKFYPRYVGSHVFYTQQGGPLYDKQKELGFKCENHPKYGIISETVETSTFSKKDLHIVKMNALLNEYMWHNMQFYHSFRKLGLVKDAYSILNDFREYLEERNVRFDEEITRLVYLPYKSFDIDKEWFLFLSENDVNKNYTI